MIKRILSVLIVAAMLAGMLPAAMLGVSAKENTGMTIPSNSFATTDGKWSGNTTSNLIPTPSAYGSGATYWNNNMVSAGWGSAGVSGSDDDLEVDSTTALDGSSTFYIRPADKGGLTGGDACLGGAGDLTVRGTGVSYTVKLDSKAQQLANVGNLVTMAKAEFWKEHNYLYRIGITFEFFDASGNRLSAKGAVPSHSADYDTKNIDEEGVHYNWYTFNADGTEYLSRWVSNVKVPAGTAYIRYWYANNGGGNGRKAIKNIQAYLASPHTGHANWTEYTGSKSTTTVKTDATIVLNGATTFSGSLTIGDGTNACTVYLCLNGKKLNMGSYTIEVKKNAILNICDCQSGGIITSTSTNCVYNNGTLNVFGGTVQGNGTRGIFNYGTVNMIGGTVESGAGEGKAISTGGTSAVLNMSGGTVKTTGSGYNSIAISLTGGVVNLSGGTVTSTNGYGILVSGDDSTLYLSGSPTVNHNASYSAISYTSGAIYAESADGNTAYNGGAMKVYSYSKTLGKVVINNVTATNKDKFTLYGDTYVLALGTGANSDDLVIAEAATSYDIWVGGVQVTSANVGGITGSGITGTVTYDEATHTLTLSDATITGTYSGVGILNEISGVQLNIVFDGECAIDVSDTYSSLGVATYGHLSFAAKDEDASLLMRARYDLTDTDDMGTLYVDGLKVVGSNFVDTLVDNMTDATVSDGYFIANGSYALSVYMTAASAAPTHTHTWSEDYTYDETHHWHGCNSPECDVLDGNYKDVEGSGKAEHNIVNNTCTECGVHFHGSEVYTSSTWSKNYNYNFPGGNRSTALKADSQSGNITIQGGATLSLCLNGHTLDLGEKTITVISGATLNIYDCQGTGKIISTDGVAIDNSGTVNIFGGTVEGKTYAISGGVANIHAGKLIGYTLPYPNGSSYNFTEAPDGMEWITLSTGTSRGKYPVRETPSTLKEDQLEYDEISVELCTLASATLTGTGAISGEGSYQATYFDGEVNAYSGFDSKGVILGYPWDIYIGANESEGYIVPKSVTVTVGGAELMADKYTYNRAEGTIHIPAVYVTGDIVVDYDAVEAEKYDVIIEGKTLFSDDFSGEGYTYTHSDGTGPSVLTLTDAALAGGAAVEYYLAGIYYNEQADLKIVFDGTNSITVVGGDTSIMMAGGIMMPSIGSKLTFEPYDNDATLTVDASDATAGYVIAAAVATGGDIDITGLELTSPEGTVTAETGGLYVGDVPAGEVTIKAAAQPHNHDGVTGEFTEITDWSQLATSGNYYLGDTVPAVSDNITIASGVEITLCLNGKTLDLGSYYIKNKGTLTICDCQSTQGTITSGINAISNNGTLAVLGGKISAHDSAIINYGTVTVSGGTLSGTNYGISNGADCEAHLLGGTVYGKTYAVFNRGYLYLSGSVDFSNSGTSIFYSNGEIYAHQKDDINNAYTVSVVTVEVTSELRTQGNIIINDINDENRDKFSITNNGYTLTQTDDDLVLHSHTWSTDWATNETHHWHECENDYCNITEDVDKDGYAEHNYIDGFCECGLHSHDGGVTVFEKLTVTSGELASGSYYLSGNATATGNIIIANGEAVTLCLNGKTLELGSYNIRNNGTLTIVDCKTAQGTISSANSENGIIYNAGTLTINAGNVIYTGSEEYAYSISNEYGQTTVNGGHIDGIIDNYAVFILEGGNITNSGEYSAIQNSGGVTVVNGGSIENDYLGIFNYCGYLYVSGGSITSTECAAISNYDGYTYIYGAPVISGNEENYADIVQHYSDYAFIYARNEEGNVAYTGGALTVSFDYDEDYAVGNIAIAGIDDTTETKFTLLGNEDYILERGTVTDESTGLPIDVLVLALAHVHDWADAWSSDGTAHWHECEAADCYVTENSEKDGYVTHSAPSDDNSCTTAVKCEICQYVFAAANADHTYTYSVSGAVLTEKCSVSGCTVHEKTATIKAPAGTLVYDGTTEFEAEVTYSDGWVGGMLNITYTRDGDITSAGEITASITKDGKKASVTYTIQQADGNITNISDIGKTYDGDAVSAPIFNKLSTGAATIEYKEKGAPDSTYSTTAPKNAGDYTVRVTVAADSNYKQSSATADFTIAKAKVNKPDADSTEFVYTGEKLTYSIAANVLYTVSGTVQTNAGSYKVTVALKDSDNYEWADGKTDGLEYDFNIAKADYNMSGISFADGQFTYDGNVHSLVIGGTLPTGADGIQVTVGYSGSAANVADGEVTVTATFATASTNYNVPVPMTAEVKINPKSISGAAITLGEALTYTGSEQTQTITNVKIDGLDVTYDVSGDKGINADSYELTVTGNGNFTGTAKMAWSIKKAVYAKPIGVVGVKTTFIDTTDGKLTGVTEAMEYKLSTANTYTSISGTQVTRLAGGKYHVRYKADSNHYASENIEITIGLGGKRLAKVDFQSGLTLDKTYDGSAVQLGNGDYTYMGDGKVTVTWYNEKGEALKGAPKDAGTYYVGVSAESGTVYNAVSEITKKFVISKAWAVINIDTADIVKTYGEAWELPAAYSNLGTVICDKVIGDLVNAGTYTVTYSVTGTDNYNGDTKSIKVIINKATYDMSDIVLADKTVVYNGEAHSITVDGALPEGVAVEYTNNGKTQVGIYTVTATFICDTDNYNAIAPMTATLTVNKDEIIDHVGEEVSGGSTEMPHVIVTAEGGFASKIEIVISEISLENNRVEEAIDIFDKVGAIYDITLESDGVKIQPNGEITIRLLIPEWLRAKSFRILHNHEGEIAEVDYEMDEDYAVFTVDRLSEFSIVYYQFPWWIIVIAVMVLGGVASGIVIYKRKRTKA